MQSGRKTMLKSCAGTTSFAMLLLARLPAVAAPALEQSAQSSPPVGIPGVLGFGVSLILVIVAILVVGWLYAQMRGVRGASSNVINILASQSLGSKEKIVLVEVGDKQIVVGMTAAHLQTLHVFEEPVVSSAERAGNSAFAERLLKTLKGIRK